VGDNLTSSISTILISSRKERKKPYAYLPEGFPPNTSQRERVNFRSPPTTIFWAEKTLVEINSSQKGV
jgi:hypothetical protein